MKIASFIFSKLLLCLWISYYHSVATRRHAIRKLDVEPAQPVDARCSFQSPIPELYRSESGRRWPVA
eukprot:11171973-Lingulodinium_polyedra.AAC.1